MSTNGLIESSLSEVCSLVTDGTHDTPTRVENGYPLIKAKEIVGGRIDFETCDQISKEEHLEVIARSKPEQGDTLFAHIGASLGEAAYVNTSREFSIKNIALFKPNPAVIDGRYLYYLVISPEFQALAKGTKTGSAQPFLSLGQLRSHRIRFHRDFEIQRRIADILSAYDDLIENNQRRIKILEGMARSLYREWFVNFRFPGHQKVSLVDSPIGAIPKGWTVKTLGDMCKVIPGYAFKSKEWQDSGVSVIKIKNIREDNTVDTSETNFVSDEIFSAIPTKFILQHGDFLLAMTGATAGKIGRLRTGNQMLLNQRVAKILPDERFRAFVWCAISSEESKDRFFRLADGAAQPNMSGSQIERVKLLTPPKGLVNAFSRITDATLVQIDNLYLKNLNLRRSRELLLPRLLSGQVALPL